ncbi:glycine oxidase [Pullulanibacillus pueri]|uniref:glycine oxidase n=1 Tax=Pullulanibacillus pueri TaxID=1437324 RepID=A0A8J3EL29_9BACL|nr:glycine oxidase ThiO [Pullulanibacillus pueri]MBM7681283.1 glycine oxidase [Pullulanibacillus pueri]GGH77751.1 glycine oxidase ThiO [Pullulanibacillus pueri]
MKPKQFDAIIIGGGVMGCSIAYQLSKRKKKVLLLEKNQIGCEASSAAAGMLGVQAELEAHDPLFELAKSSRALFSSLASEIKALTHIDIELIHNGQLKMAQNEEQVESLKAIGDWQRSIGEEAIWLDREALLNLEPCLSENLHGALYFPKEGQVYAPNLTQGFAKASALLGTKIREYCEVQSLILSHHTVQGVRTLLGDFYAETIIVATGAWSGQWLPQELQQKQPLYPVKGEAFSLTTHAPFIKRTLFTKGCYIVPKRGGQLLVGATMHAHTFDKSVSLQGLSSLMNKAKEILPIIETATMDRFWSGIRPMTQDGFPYLGEHPDIDRLFIATGHYRNGILLSPITGQLIAEMVTDQRLSVPLNDFRINRHIDTQEVLT